MVRIDDSDRVFDVSRPNRVGANPTSRPVIMGHHPRVADPMMREDGLDYGAHGKKVTPVTVTMDSGEDEAFPAAPAEPEAEPVFGAVAPVEHEVSTDLPAAPAHDSEPDHPQPPAVDELFAPDKTADNSSWASDGTPPVTTLPLSHAGGSGPKRPLKKYLTWLATFLVLAGVGTYLAIDAGLVGSNIKLPFEIFKEEEPAKTTTTTPAAVTTPPPAATDIPEGFTLYKLSGTSVSFAYPDAWGTPAPVADPGFSKRGGALKSDGTYAYLVNFATNKDVQVVLTSNKYLPAERTALYYDFLQWCVGTNDAKFYKQLLRFTTVNGIDTPTTVTCDQGPLTDGTKLDETTISQLKTKGPDNKDIGDLYTKNLTDKELSVLRVKDATSANADLVKKLLATVKVEAAR